MSKLSLAGAWKLRGEFMDVTAERYNEVLRKMAQRFLWRFSTMARQTGQAGKYSSFVITYYIL